MSELDLHFGISDPDGVAADLEVLVGSTADQSADNYEMWRATQP